MRAYLKLSRAGLVAFARDRAGLFWSFFFPLFFVIMFGLFFGGESGGRGTRLPVGVIVLDPSPTTAWVPGVFRQVPVLEVRSGTVASETRELKAGRRRAVVVFPADFSQRFQAGETAAVRVLYDPTQQQTSQMALGVIRQVLEGIDSRLRGGERRVTAQEEPVLPAGEGERRTRVIDFLLPGILGMMLMQLGLFTALPIIAMREKGILKRLQATPLPRSTWVASQVTQRLVIGVGQTLVLLALGRVMFRFSVAGSWLALFGLVVLGVLTFVAMGAVLSGFAKTLESGAPLVQVINFPMMFLSGLFFPPELIPPFLRPVRDILPATHLADALRYVTRDAPAYNSMPVNLLVMLGWLIVSLAAAARVFRWE